MNEIELRLSQNVAIQLLNSGKTENLFLNDRTDAVIVANAYKTRKRNMILVMNNLYTAQLFYNRLYPLLEDEVLLFGVEESLRVEAVASSPTMYATQMETLTTIVTSDQPHVIVTHPMALIRYLPAKEVFERHIIELKVGRQIGMAKLKQLFIEAGYRPVNKIEQPLTFSARGGVIDVFSIQHKQPLRIEFFDDEIDSLRFFDIATQRTVRNLTEATVMPASTLVYKEEFKNVEDKILKQLKKDIKKCDYEDELTGVVNNDIEYLRSHLFEHRLYRYYSFFDKVDTFTSYLDHSEIILFNRQYIQENLEYVLKDSYEYVMEQYQNGEALNYYSLFADFERSLKGRILRVNEGLDEMKAIHSGVKEIAMGNMPLEAICNQLYVLSRSKKLYLCISKARKEMLHAGFENVGLKESDIVEYVDGSYQEGFEYEDFMLITEKELFGTARISKRYENKFSAAEILDDYQQLQPGDYVVHSAYGVGMYAGIVNKVIRGIHKDFLDIHYRDDEQLLVPLEQFKLVRKYVGSEGVGIRLNSLHNSAWKKAREKVQQDVNNIAERLIRLYADREQNIGYAFRADDDNQKQFESEFEYELTKDQQIAIDQVKKDMEQSKPMDRLLCGDVGFGKTEVAMVGAFKAVNDCKQVAYLCPTTILSRQHYNTFKERFKNFPVKVALLNRFVSDAEQKRIVKAVKNGEIDILIGTHRILSKDVEFYDLGLLIVDEEQRFGVEAKEKIKEFKKSIDVLSLSATPIPRTLQLSLVGVMSLSQLDTPPVNRIPIQTYVVEKSDSLIREVIQRELARGGQVFYLHNNIATIYDTARKILSMIPDARIGIGHGKMSREEIEDVMYRFTDKQYDILLCTTIIETGIDIANANTMIIEDADRFGLSQLYQIRGRVGRSDKVAYAYLMYGDHKRLSEIASKRLQAIKDFTELGSGYKIAMRDLTIRGAGDLLGSSQSGFINTVGMDLYLEMLQKAIEEKKGITPAQPKEQIKLEVDGYIPQMFTQQDYEKLSLYQRIDKIETLSQLQELREEIGDRYGRLPDAVRLLFEKKRLQLLLASPSVDRFEDSERQSRIVLTQQFSDHVDGVTLFNAIKQLSNDNGLKYVNKQIILIVPKNKNWFNMINKVADVVHNLEEK